MTNIDPLSQNGFTLIEMAIVLAIMALALGSGLTILTVQLDQRRIEDTNALLSMANEALIGFALANGRLPCPASPTSNGVESPAGGACTNALNGFLPGATLGLSGVDANGYLTDAWKLTQNRIRYAVTTANANAATTADGIKGLTISGFSPDLYLCASATGITATTCGTATTLSNNAVAVLYSLGKNAATDGTGADEAANMNNDSVFVSHIQATADEAGGEFDDQLTWLSRYTLFNRMVQAGKLP
jgi:prepilin-type N-terminal cleavage/methylation domain-containing protein